MKSVSPVFEDRGRRESYPLALSVVLIFVFCTLIAYTAFASTEANIDEPCVAIEPAGALVIGEVKSITDYEGMKKTYGDIYLHGNCSTLKAKRGVICNASYYASGFMGIKTEIATHEVGIEADPESLSLTDGDKMLYILATAKAQSNLRYGQYPQAKSMKVICPLKEGEIRIEIEKN